MTLRLHRAGRTDRLADALAELLRTPQDDPFTPELVVVPARGIERWLSQRLSHRLGRAEGRQDGVCAGVDFRTPGSLAVEVLGLRAGAEDPWSAESLTWPLLAEVDASSGEPWARVLAVHLGYATDGEEAELRRGRRYAVARRLAGLFCSYAAQRPTILADWESGRDTDGAGGPLPEDLLWQPELWRRLVARVGSPSPGERHAAARARLVSGDAEVRLPSRLSLFGHTRLSAADADLLHALARRRDVHIWLPHPSADLWERLLDLRGRVPRSADPSAERVRHPLLAALGRDLREVERTLLPIVDSDEVLTEPESDGPNAGSLLGWLQADLARDQVPPAYAERALAPGDHSVQVHACHGPARQVEVLREVLLGLLADDPTLEPRDIVVMCPDIEAYAPLVQAAFGLGDQARPGSHPGHRLRVRLADRALLQTNPVLGVVARLLDLADSRFEASRVLDLLATGPVRRRFALSEDDLEQITDWVAQAGIRWALDAEHRARYRLDGYVQNTWRFGLDRILAGVALSDDARQYVGATLPLDDVPSTTIELAGKLAECLDRIRRLADRLTGIRPVEEWRGALLDAVEELAEVAPDEEWQTSQFRRELDAGLSGQVRPAGEQVEAALLRLADVRSLLAGRLGGRPSRANFRTGSITVSTMVPMRSVPHRVVCLVGLDDGVFPRAGEVDGDNALTRGPLTGERDPRSEDRQLMLDAVLAAGDHLVVTYTGADEVTGRPRPYSVPVGELLEALDATVQGGAARALRRHRLQAFDPDNFAGASPSSFDVHALAGARAASAPRAPTPRLAEVCLPPRPGDVDLDELTRFLRQPVKEFLRSRLTVSLPEDAEEVADSIPVDLDGLDRWQVGDRMLTELLAGLPPDEVLAREWRRGQLPPGQLGWQLARSLKDDARPLADMADTVRGGSSPRAVDVRIDLGGGRLLTGAVTDVYGDRAVRVSFSRFGPRHLLDAWVAMLALCAGRPNGFWSAGTIGRGYDGSVERRVFGAVEDPEKRLGELVSLYDAGMRSPLPLPLKTGFAWAKAQAWPDRARRDAERAWTSRWGGESTDPAHVYVWGRGAPFEVLVQEPRPGEEYAGQTTRLGALACRLWRPILEAQ